MKSESEKSLSHVQLFATPMNYTPPTGSSVLGILQVRILEWVAIPFSRGSSWPRDRTWVSCTAGILYHLSHQGSPLGSISYSFSPNLESVQPLSIQVFFLPLSFSPFFLEIQLHMHENTWYYQTDLWGFIFFSVFSLFFKPDTLCCSIFQLTDSSASSYLLLCPSTEFFISVFILLSSRTPIWLLFYRVHFPVFHSFLVYFSSTLEFIFL